MTLAPLLWFAAIHGTINPATSSYLSSAIHHAEADNAQALIVQLDTPGGLVSSVRDMAQSIDRSRVPVVVYVAPAGASATSAGAILMFASHVAAMAPGTNIGAAHPVGAQGEEIKGVMGQKIVNDTAAMARGLAELRGRNRALAEEIVSKSRSFTAEEAAKSGLIEIIAPDRAALLKALDGFKVRVGGVERAIVTRGASERTLQMTLGQTVLHYLADPNIATVLMTVGILLMYLELSHPGIAAPGILGGISLLASFVAYQLLPIRVGGLVLLFLGALLLVAEPFVVSHGAFAAGGLISLVLGILWVMDPSATESMISPAIWIPAIAVLGGIVLLIAYGAARTQRLTRRALASMGGGELSGLTGYSGRVESTSAGGRSGKAQFRGELWDFVSDEPVAPGDPVVVVTVAGMKAQVKKVSHARE